MALAFCGIVEILAGGQGFSLEGFISRLLEHPLSYILAVGAAVTWAAFSSMTRAWGGSTNLACLIFCINASIYGVLWLCGFGTQMVGELGLAGSASSWAALRWAAHMLHGRRA